MCPESVNGTVCLSNLRTCFSMWTAKRLWSVYANIPDLDMHLYDQDMFGNQLVTLNDISQSQPESQSWTEQPWLLFWGHVDKHVALGEVHMTRNISYPQPQWVIWALSQEQTVQFWIFLCTLGFLHLSLYLSLYLGVSPSGLAWSLCSLDGGPFGSLWCVL